ncbi:unnamed protein product [Calypogeia fissa]
MSGEEGPDSDSSGSEFRKSVTKTRSRRAKEARICYSSRTTTLSLQDPMPEYVDPELVKLIAQNAPFELDVFVRSLQQKNSTKRRAENDGLRKGGAVKEDMGRPVEALLSSVMERNDHLSTRNKPGRDVRHSCPEQMWRDSDEKDEEFICRAKAVKRKRPKGLDGYRVPPADRPFPAEASLCTSENKGRRKLRGASPGHPVTPGDSSDEASNFLEDERLPRFKADGSEVSLAAGAHSVGNGCDAKPWRHGMRKGTRSAAKDEKLLPYSTCCKRKAGVADSQKTSEKPLFVSNDLQVRKYMEMKMLERRKEQQQLKADADAALVARKEQQRKLDLHRQAKIQSQLSGGKSREHAPRPAWVSEYSSLCEPPRPWSSSSGELNTCLPPPVTPPKLELVPLDLYATQFQYAEEQSATPRTDGVQLPSAQPREKRRSKKVKGCSREVHRHLKYRKSQIMKEYLNCDAELTKVANSPNSRKAKWKAKTKPRGSKLFSEECFQLQLLAQDEANLPQRSGDLEVYKRSLQRQCYSNGRSVCKASRTDNSTSRVSPKTPTKSVRPPENSVKSAFTDHVRPLLKVKRLKPTERFIPGKTKDLTGEELATLLNANKVPSDCESETDVKDNGQVIAERIMIVRSSPPASEQEMITDLRKCVGHSLGSPQQKNTTGEEDVLCKWYEPSIECSEDHLIDEDVRHKENSYQMLDNSLKSSRSKEVQLHQFLDFQKEKVPDSEILRRTTRKQTTLAVRWQRMQLLKNLAEQLVKRVNEACAKKRQLECSAVEQIKSPSMDVDTLHPGKVAEAESGHELDSPEPKLKVENQPKLSNGLSSTCPEGCTFDENKFLESELKFFQHHQPKQNSALLCTGLTEQEHAGCKTPSVHVIEMELKNKQSRTTSAGRRASRSEANDDSKRAGGLDSNEICTMMDWTTADKVTDVTCINPAICSGFGPSSLSTGSSSPVILPTSSKYHLGRLKPGKTVSNHEKTRCLSKKLDWIIPAENDTQSLFNVYTQHLKQKEKLASRTFHFVVPNDLEKEKETPRIAEPVAQEDNVNVIGNGPNPLREQHLSSSNFESLQNMVSGADKDAGISPAKLKTDLMEPAGISPEVTILEIGDLKLCQSPTYFHLRLDRCKDSRAETNPKEQKLADISTCVDSKQETRGESVNSLIPPMKVTYARRVHSRAMPDGGCTDERVVVELRRTTADVPSVELLRDFSLGSPKLNALVEAPQGLPSSRRKKGIASAQSDIQEVNTVKLSTVDEEVKQGHMSSKVEGNAVLQPKIEHVPDPNKLFGPEGESISGQKGQLAPQPNFSSKPDPRTDLRDSQEWELKLRLDQLEVELQTLDAEIMKTKARLHQRHSMTDIQVHNVSCSPSAEQPVERSINLDQPSKFSQRSAEDLANIERHNVILEQVSDLQIQKNATASHSSAKSRRDEEKNVTSSNSYTDSFLSEDTETGQKIVPRRGTCDPFAGHPASGKTMNLCSKSFVEPQFVSQQFEGPLEDRPRGSRSHAVKRQGEAQSYCQTPSTQGDFPSEGSEMSTGRGPGTRLDMPLFQVDSEESTGDRHRIFSKVTSIRPDISNQLVAVNVGDVQSCVKDEGKMLESHTTPNGDDELRGAVQDSVDTRTDICSRMEPSTFPDSINEKIEGKITRDTRQTFFQQNARILGVRRNSHELPECGARDSQSTVVQCGSPNTENSNNRMPGGARNRRLAGTAGVDTSNSNRKPSACIQQNGWPMKGEQEVNLVTFDEVEELLPRPIGSEQKERRTFVPVFPSTTMLSSVWTASANGGSEVPGRELGKESSQMNGEELMVTKKRELSGGCQNAKTLALPEDSFTVVDDKLPIHYSVEGSEDYIIPVVPSRGHCALQQTSPSLVDNPGQAFSHCNIGPASKVKGRMKAMLNDGKVSTCADEEGQMSEEAPATIVPQSAQAVSLSPVHSVACSPTTNETNWESLSLPSHMDFSTIKEKLKNNRLADDDLRPFSNSWSSYQNESFKSSSISEEAGGDSSGLQTVASERIIPSDASHKSENLLHEIFGNVEIEQAAKSIGPPEMGPNEEDGLRALRSESTRNIEADPNYPYSDTLGLLRPCSSSAGEPPNFLPSFYFRQDIRKSSNPSEDVESTISEDLENYESDIEELQDDAMSAGSNFETTSTWITSTPIRSNTASASIKPDSACCVGVGSPDMKTVHSELGVLSATKGLTSRAVEICNSGSSIQNIFDQDLTALGVPKPCAVASGMCQPPTDLFSRLFENPLSLLHPGDECNSQPAASCTSRGDADGEVTGELPQSCRAAVNEDDNNILHVTRLSDKSHCGSEVSYGSHLRSESISEEIFSVDSDTISSSRSGPQKENRTHLFGLVELNTREESNENHDDTQAKCVDDAGSHYPCNAVASFAAPPEPRGVIENADRQHYSPGIADFITTAGLAVKDPPDTNSSSTDCAATAADFEGLSRSRDHTALPVGSHIPKFQSSNHIKLPRLPKIPQLRISDDSIQGDNGTHLSTVSNDGKLSCAQDSQVRETLPVDEKLLLESISGMQLESALKKHLVNQTPSDTSPRRSITGPGEIVKSAKTILHREPSDPGTTFNLDVASVEGSPVVRMQKSVEHLEVSGPSSYQIGSIRGCNAKSLAVDIIVQKGDSNRKNALAEEVDDTHNLSHKLTAADSSSDKENARSISVGEEDNEPVVAVCSTYGYSGPGLRKFPYQRKNSLAAIPWDCAGSKSDPTTFASKDKLESSCLDLFSDTSENQRLSVEYRVADESRRSFNSFHDDHGGPAATTHPVVPADRDVQNTESSFGCQNIPKNRTCEFPCIRPMRPDQIIALQGGLANERSSTSPPLEYQRRVVDFDKHAAEDQAQRKSSNRHVSLGSDCNDKNGEFEGHTNNQMDSPVCAHRLQPTHLRPARHGSVMFESLSNCTTAKTCGCSSSSEKAFLSDTQHNIYPRDSSDNEARKLRKHICSSNGQLLESAQTNRDIAVYEELSHFETPEDEVGCLGSKPVSGSNGPDKEEMMSATYLTALQEASSCFSTCCDAPQNKLGGIMQKMRMEVEARRAEKRNVMTDLLTSMIYEDLLCAELSGFDQEVERKTSTNQTAKLTRPFNPKVKSRSRKVSEFCQVLKQFLPTGWRSASIRHKTGLFLHVEGLRPHPATRAVPGVSKRNVQYPSFAQSEDFPETATSQFLLLDLSDVHSYVQRSLKVSGLILDPGPANWYDPKKPIVEHVISGLESQHWEGCHIFEHSKWQIHEELLTDLINETLLKHFATKLLVPSVGITSLPLPAGGEDLVQFVTNGIVEHERYASKHGFDIEKVIARAFEDEHWEKCSDEAIDVIGDLAQDILGDLIERFVYEMIRGWCYYINQCHVLAT